MAPVDILGSAAPAAVAPVLSVAAIASGRILDARTHGVTGRIAGALAVGRRHAMLKFCEWPEL